MKCLYCKLPIESTNDAFVTIPNSEQCGYRARQATKFVHARCFEKEIRRTAQTQAVNALKAALPALEQGREFQGEVLDVCAQVREAILIAEGADGLTGIENSLVKGR